MLITMVLTEKLALNSIGGDGDGNMDAASLAMHHQLFEKSLSFSLAPHRKRVKLTRADKSSSLMVKMQREK